LGWVATKQNYFFKNTEDLNFTDWSEGKGKPHTFASFFDLLIEKKLGRIVFLVLKFAHFFEVI